MPPPTTFPPLLHFSRLSAELFHPGAPCCRVKVLKATGKRQIYGRTGTSLADAETSGKRPAERIFPPPLMMRVERAGVDVDCGGGGDATERGGGESWFVGS